MINRSRLNEVNIEPQANPYAFRPELPGAMGEPEQRSESIWKLVDDRMRGRWKRALIIGLSLALVLGILGFALTEPMYEGRGAILIKPNATVAIYNTPENEELQRYYESFRATQVQFVQSDSTLLEALKNERLAAHPWSKQHNALKKLKKGLTVQPDRQSQLVSVKFEDEDPVVAELATNAVLDAYYELFGKNGGGIINQQPAIISDYLTTRTRELLRIREDRKKIITKYDTTDLKTLQHSHLERIGELESYISQGRAQIERLKRSNPAAADGTFKIVPTQQQLESRNTLLATLRAQRDAAQVEFDMIKQKYHASSVPYGQKENQAKRAKEVYDQEYQKALREWELKGPDTMVAEGAREGFTEADLQAWEQSLVDLKKRQSELAADLAFLDDLDFREKQVQHNVDEATKRQTSLDVESDALRNTISIAGYARRPDEPDIDERRKTAVVGAGLGLFGVLGVFFLLGTVDRRAYGSSQLQHLSNTMVPTCLGVLPDLGASLSDPESNDVASHCVHQIRNQIEALRDPHVGYVLAITSPFQGDGKTSIVMALGWSYAAAGFNTLLIDCDLVGRSLTRQLGLVGREGLKEAMLAGEMNGSVSRLPVDHLCAVPVGVDHRFGPENIRRLDLQRLIDQVRTQYDIILVDTGPMLGSLESTPVTATADGVVLSVRRGRSRSRLEDCVSKLETLGTRCIGVILNCAVRSDCNRYVSEASLAAAEEERTSRSESNLTAAAPQAAPGERNALVRAVQTATRTRIN